MRRITQSFIFAAGRGNRMRPLTDTIPKPMAVVGDKSIIDYIIEKLHFAKFEKITVNGHYLTEKLQNHLRDKDVVFSQENEKLETGGGLVFAAKNKKIDLENPILLVNGDILWQGGDDISYFCDDFFKKDCDILLGLKKVEDFFGYDGDGDFDLGENGELLNDAKTKKYVFTGLQIIDPKILKFAPEKSFSMNYFYKNAKKLGLKIKGVELGAQFFHIGDVETLQKVNDIWHKKTNSD